MMPPVSKISLEWKGGSIIPSLICFSNSLVILLFIIAEIVPITEGQAHYIEMALTSFEEIKEVYNKGLFSGGVLAPKIQRQ